MKSREERALMRRLREAIRDTGDNVLFQEAIIDFATIMKLSDLELSELLKTSRPTISRWKSGNTTPHRMIKGAAYRTLLKFLVDKS